MRTSLAEGVPGLLLETLHSGHPDVDVLRLDRLHAEAPGNKWFKLKANLAEARRVGAQCLVSFGGAHSNHLHALAAVAREAALPCYLFVRADAGQQTPCLADAARWGATIIPLSRSDYRRRHEPAFVASLLQGLTQPYLIPEGGANALGAQGCADIAGLLPDRGAAYDLVMVACGTGSTLAGLAKGVADGVAILGVPVVKKAEQFMPADIQRLLADICGDRCNWSLDCRFIGKGFGQLTPPLIEFIRQFEQRTAIPLDPVYTAKLFYAAETLRSAGEFKAFSRVLVVHTGGLQGRRGYPEVFNHRWREASHREQ